ncbi:MAG: YCF48-related protein [Chitinophagales bacterium]
MKNILLFLLIVSMAILGCTKDKAVQPSTGRSLPYENKNLKMELVSAAVPAANDMHFFNENTGIVSTYDGKIYKSIDGGKNWILKFSDTTPDRPLNAILFPNENVGYAAGGAGWCSVAGCLPSGAVLLKTSDAGENWSIVFQITGRSEFSSIASNGKGDLFLIENDYAQSFDFVSKILKSEDGGINWSVMASFDVALKKIIFNKNNGFCIGTYGKIIRSIDDGNTWNESPAFEAGWISDIAFNNSTGYCITNSQTVYKSTDNGENWDPGYTSSTDYFYKLSPLFDNYCLIWGAVPNTGGCFGSNAGSVIHSNNAGSTWESTQFKDITSVWESSFYATHEGYVLAREIGGNKLIKVTVN